MLVLTRKLGEAIDIDGVIVTVLEIRGGRIRLGVEAPPDVPVHRQEHQREPAGAPQENNS